MKKLHKKLRSYKARKYSKPLLFVLGVAVIGTATLLITNAATNNYFIEPETSTLSGNASTVADTTASGGQAVKFTTGTGGSTTCALPKYPTPSCTGTPAGTTFTNTVGDYNATTDGQVFDGWHFTADLGIMGNNITIKNSQIDGTIQLLYQSTAYRVTIQDTTIGKANVCVTSPGIDTFYDVGGYTAQRVQIRGHDDGFRAGGPNITIRDSYVKNCGNETSHADGIQDYPWTQNLIFDHNTMDLCGPWTTVPTSAAQCDVNGHNSPIFIAANAAAGNISKNVTLTNNLAMGGVWTLYLVTSSAPWVITGNRVVNNTWDYGAYETGGYCANITNWSDNRIVTINPDYTIASTVSTVACPN